MYDIRFIPASERDFSKLPESMKIALKHIHFPLIQENPFSGKPLKGNFKGFWKYAFSYQGVSYRVVYEINRKEIFLVIIMIGSRESIYKRLKDRVI